MKKIFYSIFAAVAMFTACNEEVITDGTGSLNLKIGEVSDKYMTKSDAIDKDEFYVTLTDWNGNVVESDGVTYRNILYKNLPDEISGLPSGPGSPALWGRGEVQPSAPVGSLPPHRPVGNFRRHARGREAPGEFAGLLRTGPPL